MREKVVLFAGGCEIGNGCIVFAMIERVIGLDGVDEGKREVSGVEEASRSRFFAVVEDEVEPVRVSVYTQG